jgi:hypothetical protein
MTSQVVVTVMSNKGGLATRSFIVTFDQDSEDELDRQIEREEAMRLYNSLHSILFATNTPSAQVGNDHLIPRSRETIT